MRKLLLFLLLNLAVCSTALAFTGAPIDDPNCQAAYLFLEGSGVTVADSSQNSNTGTFASSGHPSWSAIVPAAFEDYSALFVSGDYIDCGASTPSPGSGDFTYVHWVRTSDTDTFSMTTRISTSGQGYEFLIGSATNAGNIAARVGGASGARTTSNFDGYDDNAFHFLACVITAGVSPYGRLYIDGAGKGNLDADPGAITNSQNLHFGKRGTSVLFDGYVGESAIFDRELTSTEINDIMDNGLAGGGAPPVARRFFLVQ